MKAVLPTCLLLLAPVLAAQTANTPRTAAPSPAAETVEVTHCLKAGDLDWTANSPQLQRAKTFRIGLRRDETSYPHQDLIIVVVFENSRRGDVFEMTRKDNARQRTYRIENNGEFKIEKRGIEWPGEILGGNWTHDYIEAHIRKIMLGPKTTVSLKALTRPMPDVACTSYVSDVSDR